MFQTTCKIDNDLADVLENYFCNYEISQWALRKFNKSEGFSLTGYSQSITEAEAKWSALHNVFPELPEKPEMSQLQDCDWKDAYKKHYRPWNFEQLHWVPE